MLPGGLNLLTSAGAFAGVLGLIWGLTKVARISGLAPRRATSGGLIIIKDVIALDSRSRLYLIGCRGRDVLLLLGGDNGQVIGWLSSNDPSSLP